MAKRFYKNVGTKEAGSGFHVTLDGRVLKTPGKQPLVCPTLKQALEVAAEWDAQVEDIKPETMPCTRLMNVACEMTPTNRPDLIAEFRKYCGTDLLCYRASDPKDLAERQGEYWQPLLDWSAKVHKIAFPNTTGLEAIPQPEASLKTAAEYARELDDTKLTLLLHYTASFGSGVLGLAVLDEHISAETAFNLSCLDEHFQNERWGEDEEAVARNAGLLTELNALSKLI